MSRLPHHLRQALKVLYREADFASAGELSMDTAAGPETFRELVRLGLAEEGRSANSPSLRGWRITEKGAKVHEAGDVLR